MGKDKRDSDRQVPESVTPLLSPLQALQDILSEFNNQGVIIGGIAASLLGTPRYTKDLADIQAISASHQDLDKERIQLWVEQFGEALDLPNLWETISRLL